MYKIGDRVEFIDTHGGRVKIGDKGNIVGFTDTFTDECAYIKTDNGRFPHLSCLLWRFKLIENKKSHPLTKIFT